MAEAMASWSASASWRSSSRGNVRRACRLGQIGVKRMMNQKLSMGWSAWLEMYQDYQRKKAC